MTHHQSEVEQRTEAWRQMRLGKVTASRVADVMATIRSGEAAARKNYRMELLCERLSGTQAENFVSAPMQRGIDLEPIARGTYEGETGSMVQEVAFIDHPSIPMFGASPDGLVGDDGMLEIKVPNTATHIEFLMTGRIDPKYEWQMTCQMACADRKWCDFVSFDDRLPTELAYKCVRYQLDPNKAADMCQEVISFLAELDQLVAQMKSMMEKKS